MKRFFWWGGAFLILLLAGVVGAFVSSGLRPGVIMSGSMEPVLPVHSMIVIRSGGGPFVPGKIIVFHEPRRDLYVAHRVTERLEAEEGVFYITKGDANPREDPYPVPEKAVVGEVVLILPYTGKIIHWLQTNPLVAGLLQLPGVVVSLFILIRPGGAAGIAELVSKSFSRIRSLGRLIPAARSTNHKIFLPTGIAEKEAWAHFQKIYPVSAGADPGGSGPGEPGGAGPGADGDEPPLLLPPCGRDAF